MEALNIVTLYVQKNEKQTQYILADLYLYPGPRLQEYIENLIEKYLN